MIETLDHDRCRPCGICMEVCPMDVFRREAAAGRYVIAYPDDCMTCFTCEIDCPEDAITVAPWRAQRRQAWPRLSRAGDPSPPA